MNIAGVNGRVVWNWALYIGVGLGWPISSIVGTLVV